MTVLSWNVISRNLKHLNQDSSTMNKPTSSPASEDGPTHSNSRVGLSKGKSGPPRVPVSLLVAREKLREFSTKGTFGPIFEISSPSAILQRSLENKLRVRMAAHGSPEYDLTWKEWDMPSGLPICALRASGRRTSGNGSTGWPTPVANDDNRSVEAHLAMKARMGGNRTAITSLQVMVQTSGPIQSPSPAGTEKRGALNPAFSRWLQGYPAAWCQAAIRASRKLTALKKRA